MSSPKKPKKKAQPPKGHPWRGWNPGWLAGSKHAPTPGRRNDKDDK